MTRGRAARKRDKLASTLARSGSVLRGSLLERTTFHAGGCPKCARGEGHPQWVLNVNYPGATGRKMRVDTTVVETNIHYPTDSTLMGDGVRVLTRVMKKVAAAAGEAGTKLRDRSRSVKRRILQIAYAARDKSERGQQKSKPLTASCWR